MAATTSLEERVAKLEISVNGLKRATNRLSEENDMLNFENGVLKMKLEEKEDTVKNRRRMMWRVR